MAARFTSDKQPRRAHKCALLIIDMLNEFAFPEAKSLYKHALPAAHVIAKLKERLKKKNIPVIYVNDNFGQWLSDWKTVYEKCRGQNCIGREIAEVLRPEEDDYFVLKPKHSGFYETPLEILLTELGVKHLIITGIAGNICVLYTANDAKMRDYEMTIVSDGVASNTKKENDAALGHAEMILRAHVVHAKSVRI